MVERSAARKAGADETARPRRARSAGPWWNMAVGVIRRALRGSSSAARAADILASTVDLASWRTANASSFAPPICNKLMHKADLSVMAVGGPNTRTDFHLEAGAEFFWQVQGDMELPIVERGNQRRLVRIREGEVFLLPPRIPVRRSSPSSRLQRVCA